MAKVKTKWVCQNCGYETAKYLGKCPDCLSWGTIVEEEVCIQNSKTSGLCIQNFSNQKPELLSSINSNQNDSIKRQKSGIDEFDRVTGGGLVLGSLNLIAGDPGIGKSTLLLQVCSNLAKNGLKLLYVSAEESAIQIKLRANRLNIDSNNEFIGKKLRDIDIKKDSLVVLIQRNGVDIIPDGDTILEEKDTLVVFSQKNLFHLA